GRVRREHACEARPWKPRRRYDGGDSCEQVHGVEDEVGGSVAAGLAKQVGDPAVRQKRHALQTERWPSTVAAQLLEPVAVRGPHGDTGVHVEPGYLRGPRALGADVKALVVECHRRALAGEPQE